MNSNYFEGNYTFAGDEGYIVRVRKGYMEHWHIANDEVLTVLTSFANGGNIYIEDTRRFSLVKVRVMEKSALKRKR